MTTFTESVVEDATLAWFAELGYTIAHGPDLAPSEAASERATCGDVVLVERVPAAKRANPEADTSKWEDEIDELVHQLYGLTEEEIKIVEGEAQE